MSGRHTEPASAAPLDDAPSFGAMLGITSATPQYGILGTCADGRMLRVALDLNGCNTIAICGVQGFGKSYTLGAIAEMSVLPIPRINKLPRPMGAVMFHYHRNDTYEPEHISSTLPNSKRPEVARLAAEYGASPAALTDVVLLAPEAKVETRRAEHPGLDVQPLTFSSAEIGPEGWKFLLGATGNDSLYIRQLVAVMRQFRRGLTVDKLRQEILSSDMSIPIQKLALDRLKVAEPYINDERRLGSVLRPGRTVIVDLRDEWIEKDEALGLFVVMKRIFEATTHQGREFGKLIVFDEAHKYLDDPRLIDEVLGSVAEMRHTHTTIVIASQNPSSIPKRAIELSSVFILHRTTSPSELKHLRSAISALDAVDIKTLASLAPGEAMVWAQRSTDRRFTLAPQKVLTRPRFTQHGGGTKTAVR